MKKSIFILLILLFHNLYAVDYIRGNLSSPIVNSDGSTFELTSTDIDRINPCASFSNYLSCDNIVNESKVCVKYPLNINYIVSGTLTGSMNFYIENDSQYPFDSISIYKNNILINGLYEQISNNKNVDYEIKYCIKYSGVASKKFNKCNIYFILGID